jgi:hypothetical protein
MPSNLINIYCGRRFTAEQEDLLKRRLKALGQMMGTNNGLTLLQVLELDPDFLGQLIQMHEEERPGATRGMWETIFLNFPKLRQAMGEAVEEVKDTLFLARTAELSPTFIPDSPETIRQRLISKGIIPKGLEEAE